jgi:hypothetical protein
VTANSNPQALRAPRTSLFEYLGIAGQERIHSQTLAWLLTPAVSPLNAAQRSALLEAFGVICTPDDADALRVQTELDSLDLVCASPRVFLVVENKLKSRQSNLQLAGYDAKIGSVARIVQTEAAVCKVFLTLSKEKSGGAWNDIDYSELLPPLLAAVEGSADPYVHDYAALLTRLVDARTAFLEKPGDFAEVHERVSWSAVKRLQNPLPAGLTAAERFICTNRLERIFVETLLRDLLVDVPNAVADAGVHGSPLVQVPLWLVELEPETWYRAGLQLQGKTLKLNIADVDYEGSAPSHRLEILGNVLDDGGTSRRACRGTSRDYRSWVWEAPQSLKTIAPPAKTFSADFAREVDTAREAWERALRRLPHKDEHRVNIEPWTPERASILRKAKQVSRIKQKP